MFYLQKKSNTSLSSIRSKHTLETSRSIVKMEKSKRKKHSKTKNRINTLFQKLKNESRKSLELSQSNSTVSLDSSNSQNDTVIVLDKPSTSTSTGLKRKNSSISNEAAKRIRNASNDCSLILVSDDNPIVNVNDLPDPVGTSKSSNTHINCSTPISRKSSKALERMIKKSFSKSKSISSQNINEDIINLTKEIHSESYLTIDLTEESDIIALNNNNVDLDKSSQSVKHNENNTLASISNTSLSMSGDSEVTVLQNKVNHNDKQMNKFVKCISKLNSSAKGKLLDLIAQNIFSGCKVSNKLQSTLNQNPSTSRIKETEEDTFIKEVILGETKSRNSIGSNIYHPSRDAKNKSGLRMIVIDGSNVAMEHTKGSTFSVKGLKICIDYFVRRGHVVKAFVPRFRCKFGKSSDPRLLDSLERQGLVVYTPSREIQGRMCTSYDDRYIIQCAAEFDGVIVTGDNYRDLIHENPRWRYVIENRLLPFTWVDDMIMFPRDPLGRHGPTLEHFLKHPNSSGPIVL